MSGIGGVRRAAAVWRWILGAVWLAACESAVQPPPERTAGPTPTPTPALASIEGTVELEGRDDHEGIQVYVPGTQRIALTDRAGRFVLSPLPPGEYALAARADGYEPASLGTVTVEASAAERIYTLAPAMLKLRAVPRPPDASAALGSLHGRVTAAGAAPPDWTRCVVALDQTPFRTTCGPDGAFLLWSLPPDTYTLRVTLEGFRPATQQVRVVPGEPTEAASIRLEPLEPPSRRIGGLVELWLADGRPSNAFDRIAVGLVGRPESTVRLGPDGSFSIDRLPPGVYEVAAWGDGFESSPPMTVDLTELPFVDLQLTLHEAAATTRTASGHATVRGVALKHDEAGLDMSGIQVALAGTGRVAVTDAEGRYEIADVPPGVYTLIAQAQGYEDARAGPIEVPADVETVEAPPLALEPRRDWPRVMITDPPDGARNVLVQREIPILIRFNKKMAPESLRNAVSIEPPVAFRVYAGRDQPDLDFDLMRIVLYGAGVEDAVAFDTTYRITLSTEARDFEGLALREPFVMTLRTGEPAVIGTIPENGGTLLDLTPGRPVVIYFNAAMDYATLTPDVLRIRPQQVAVPSLRAMDDPITGWTILYVTANWTPDTRYEITVLRRARTAGRNPLANTPYTFGFRTAPRTAVPVPPVVRPRGRGR